MKKVRGIKNGTLRHNETSEGEPIEIAIKRALENGESIGEQVAMIYTDKKDGVLPGYDIRTDRWDIALEGMDVANKSALAKREGAKKSPDSEAGESTQATGENPQTT